MLRMEISRDQVDGIIPPEEIPHNPDLVVDGVYNSVIKTSGTEVIISGFDDDWWRDISLEGLTAEIEQHFERYSLVSNSFSSIPQCSCLLLTLGLKLTNSNFRLLARPKLSIVVQEVANGTILRQSQCKY